MSLSFSYKDTYPILFKCHHALELGFWHVDLGWHTHSVYSTQPRSPFRFRALSPPGTWGVGCWIYSWVVPRTSLKEAAPSSLGPLAMRVRDGHKRGAGTKIRSLVSIWENLGESSTSWAPLGKLSPDSHLYPAPLTPLQVLFPNRLPAHESLSQRLFPRGLNLRYQ